MTRVTILHALCLAIVACGSLAAAEPTDGEDSHLGVLDITRPLGDLPAVTPDDSPSDIAKAIQGRLDYGSQKARPQFGVRVYLPAGTWAINRPVFLANPHTELVGAGPGKTTLRAAKDFGAMPLVVLAYRNWYDTHPIQECNRPSLKGVLDASVKTERFGLRMYGESPSTEFPNTSRISAPMNDLKGWEEGKAYEPGEVVNRSFTAAADTTYVCTRAHVASAQTTPGSGAQWQDAWVARIGYHAVFKGSALSGGAYDPQARRASWSNLPAFTLDLAFTLNAPLSTYPEDRLLCGASAQQLPERGAFSWRIEALPTGMLMLRVGLQDGSIAQVKLTKPGEVSDAATYRLALQIDFDKRTIDAYLRKDDKDLGRTLHDTTSLPEKARFGHIPNTSLLIGGAGRKGLMDVTICGLHTSAALRYADADTLRRIDGNAIDDHFRYFASDEGTLAFLPLTEHPQGQALRSEGILASVEQGPASGAPGQRSYGLLQAAAKPWGVYKTNVMDMTLAPGPIWGIGLYAANLLNCQLWNLEIRGGQYGITDMGFGAQYTVDLRDSVLSGSEAAYEASASIIRMTDVRIEPVGRYGLLLNGSSLNAERLQFRDPVTHRSEYYVVDLGKADYGCSHFLLDVAAEAPEGSSYPSQAAFRFGQVGWHAMSLRLERCAVANLGPKAAFLELGYNGRRPRGMLHVDDCAYRGARIDDFIRASSPHWLGTLKCAEDMPVRQMVRFCPPANLDPWKADGIYALGAVVMHDGVPYESMQPQNANSGHEPGGKGGEGFWKPAFPLLRVVPVRK